MNFQKKIVVDNETVINAELLNNIQDGIIEAGNSAPPPDLSGYATKKDLENHYTKAEIDEDLGFLETEIEKTFTDHENRIASLESGGGEIEGINFHIVTGTTQPASPEERTIWIETSTPMSDYIFSNEQPEGFLEGRIWVKTALYSPVEMSATSVNKIMLYPQYVKQCINDIWVEKKARSYYNEAWHDWIVYVYNHGDHISRLTGRWEDYAYQDTDQWNAKCYATLEDTAGEMHMYAARVSSTATQGYLGVITNNKIDISNYKTLKAKVNWLTRIKASQGISLGLNLNHDNTGNTIRNNQKYKVVDFNSSDTVYCETGEKEIALDVSNISGEWYITLSMYNSIASSFHECIIYDIILE